MITVAWIDIPGVGEVNFLWDSGRFPVCVVRGDELNWQDWVQAVGSSLAVHYHELAWENRIQWSPANSMDWHKQQTGVYKVTGLEINWAEFGNEQSDNN
jgi:hypothetical protein